jgi:hypothetical protein
MDSAKKLLNFTGSVDLFALNEQPILAQQIVILLI